MNLKLKGLALIAIFAVAIFVTSCNKADDAYIPSESEMMLKSSDNSKAVKKSDKTIAQVAEDNGFSLLLAALDYAGLTETFKGTDQYTVFAPTNDAFLALVAALPLDGDIVASDGPFAAIDALLGEGTIANVLLYHVTDGRRAANSVVPKNGVRTIETLLGSTFDVNPDLSIDAAGNSANITAANISASNGIIHVIDTVILP